MKTQTNPNLWEDVFRDDAPTWQKEAVIGKALSQPRETIVRIRTFNVRMVANSLSKEAKARGIAIQAPVEDFEARTVTTRVMS